MVSANTTVNRTLGISFVIEVLMCAGNHNKFQFTRPAAAQRAASLLGTTPEELARCIFTQGGTSTLSRSTSLRWVDLHVCVYIQDSRLLYYLMREIETWLNINYISVHNNTYCIF